MGFVLRKLATGIPLIMGVTLLSFTLMVFFGPEQTYELLGKNPTQLQIDELRHQLGYDQPFFVRYGQYLYDLITFNFGYSDSSGERVERILKRTIPVSIALVFPGFIIGNLCGMALAFMAARYQGKWLDTLIRSGSAVGVSVSYLIVIIVFQILFSSSGGLDLFPVRGWNVVTFSDYLRYVTVPTMASVFVIVGYNTRFYRAVFVEEMSRNYVQTAKAFGATPFEIIVKSVLKNCMLSISTRLMFSIPMVLISGSLLLESYFGIPGIGKLIYDSIRSGDQPVLIIVVSLMAILFATVTLLSDLVYTLIDPRLSLK